MPGTSGVELAQFFAQIQAAAVESGFHGGNAQFENLRGFLSGPSLDIPQRDDQPVIRWERLQRMDDGLLQFRTSGRAGGVRSGIRQKVIVFKWLRR